MLGRADLLDEPASQYDDPVAQGHRLGLVVGDVHRGGAQPPLQPGDLGAHPHPETGVEVGQRFVHQKGLRVADDRAAHRDALPLAAREMGGSAVQVCGQVENPRRLLHLLGDRRLVGLGQPQGEPHVLPDRHMRIEGVALEDHGDVTVLGGLVVDDPAADPQRALGDVLQPRDHVEGGGLAAAGGADQDHELAVRDAQVDVPDGEGAVGIPLGDPFEDDLGHAGGSVPLSP